MVVFLSVQSFFLAVQFSAVHCAVHMQLTHDFHNVVHIGSRKSFHQHHVSSYHVPKSAWGGGVRGLPGRIAIHCPFTQSMHWSDDRWKACLAAGGGAKRKYQYCTDGSGSIVYLRALQGHSGRNLIDSS